MCYIVFDIGGTKTRYAVMDRDADFLYGPFEEPTPKKGLCDFVSEKVKKILGEFVGDVEGISIACCGIVDSRNGVVKHSRVLGDNMELRPVIEEKFGLRTIVENDSSTALLGEKFYGKGREFEKVAYVSMGTGLGGGFYSGRLFKGIETEFGSFDAGGKEWKVVSGSKINKLLMDFLSGEKRETKLKKESNAEEIFSLASNGDIVAKDFVENVVGKYNAAGLLVIIKRFNPEIIILGGSIALENPRMILEPLKKHLKEMVDQKNILVIDFSALGKDAGLYGALVLASKNLNLLTM